MNYCPDAFLCVLSQITLIKFVNSINQDSVKDMRELLDSLSGSLVTIEGDHSFFTEKGMLD